MHLSIKTYIDLQDSEDAEAIKAYTPKAQPAEGYAPEDDISLAFIEGGSDAIPEKAYTLIITDKAELINKLDFIAPLYHHVVYVGDDADSISDIEKLDEIWPLKESAKLRKLRVERAVRAVKGYYDAWLYENILTVQNDSVPDMIWFKSKDGLHWRVNEPFCQVVQKTKDDCRGKTHGYIWGVPEEEGLACQESEEQVMRDDKLCIFEEPVLTTEGIRQFTVYKAPIHNRFGEIVGTTGIGHDITNFSNMGLELSMLTENIPMPLIMLDAHAKTVRVNADFNNISGLGAAEILSFDYHRWKAKCLTPVGEARSGSDGHSQRQEFKLKRGDEEYYYVLIEEEIRDYFNNISGYFILFQDVTMRHEYEREILMAANTDGLTGLYNRRYFYEYLRGLGAVPMTLLYMDLDHFKEINDNYGHARGDDVLKRTAGFIREIFPDGVAARLGGDEYALLLKGEVDEDQLAASIGELESAVEGLFRKRGDGDLFVTVSVGIMRTDGETVNGADFDVDAFVHAADENMYEVKKAHHEMH